MIIPAEKYFGLITKIFQPQATNFVRKNHASPAKPIPRLADVEASLPMTKVKPMIV